MSETNSESMEAARRDEAAVREARKRSRARKKLIGRVVMTLFLVSLVVLGVIASRPKPPVVDTVIAERSTLTVNVRESGETRVKDRFVLSAPITGDIGRIELRPGDTVEEGDILMRIAPLTPQLMDSQSRAQAQAQVAAALASQRQARASVARAEAALELSTRTLERQEQLANNGGVSAQVVEQASFEARARREELTSSRLGVRVADYQVRMAQAALGRYESRDGDEALEVPSPIRGHVLRVLHDQGGVVSAGTPIVELGDPATLEIAVDVLTADAVAIENGAPVTLLRWGGGRDLEGHVQRVEPSAFTKVSSLGVEEQRVNVLIDIDSPRENWLGLGDGYRVEAEIQTWQEDDVLQLPSSALVRVDEGWAVFVVNEDTVSLTPVDVPRRAGLRAQVEGIEEGTRVVQHPPDSLEDGDAVRLR